MRQGVAGVHVEPTRAAVVAVDGVQVDAAGWQMLVCQQRQPFAPATADVEHRAVRGGVGLQEFKIGLRPRRYLGRGAAKTAFQFEVKARAATVFLAGRHKRLRARDGGIFEPDQTVAQGANFAMQRGKDILRELGELLWFDFISDGAGNFRISALEPGHASVMIAPELREVARQLGLLLHEVASQLGLLLPELVEILDIDFLPDGADNFPISALEPGHGSVMITPELGVIARQLGLLLCELLVLASNLCGVQFKRLNPPAQPEREAEDAPQFAESANRRICAHGCSTTDWRKVSDM